MTVGTYLAQAAAMALLGILMLVPAGLMVGFATFWIEKRRDQAAHDKSLEPTHLAAWDRMVTHEETINFERRIAMTASQRRESRVGIPTAQRLKIHHRFQKSDIVSLG